MRGPETAIHYGPYYVEHSEIDEMGNTIREEIAVLRSGQDEIRSGQAEINSLMRTMVQNDTKRNEEIKALKREQEIAKREHGIVKEDVGALTENQEQFQGKVIHLENEMRRMDQVIRKTIRTEISKTKVESKKNTTATGRRGKARRGRSNKNRKNCQFCGKNLAASWVRRHEKSSCPRRHERNQQGRQGDILKDQMEISLGPGEVPMDQPQPFIPVQ